MTTPANDNVARSADYVKFIILSAARTGSNMLASSLNSSPDIICFRELFNWQVDFIDFNVEGYDPTSAEDRALRDKDFERFLRERIFCEHAGQVQAVGFKMPYEEFLGFPDLREWLVSQSELRVLHLKRRNGLRTLVSLRIAAMTGGWVEDRKVAPAAVFTWPNALRALRHPARAATALRRLLGPRRPAWKALRTAVRLSEEECRFFFSTRESQVEEHDRLFAEHPKLSLYYEDLLDDRRAVLERVQAFLGVEPRPLVPTTRRQNPEPLRELVENYDELHNAFRNTPYAEFFE